MHKNCEEQLQVKIWMIENEIQKYNKISDKIIKLRLLEKRKEALDKKLEHSFIYNEEDNTKICEFCGLKLENLKKERK